MVRRSPFLPFPCPLSQTQYRQYHLFVPSKLRPTPSLHEIGSVALGHLLMCWFVNQHIEMNQHAESDAPVFSQRRTHCASIAQLRASARFQPISAAPLILVPLLSTVHTGARCCPVHSLQHLQLIIQSLALPLTDRRLSIACFFVIFSSFPVQVCSSAKIYILPPDTAALLSSSIPQICAPL